MAIPPQAPLSQFGPTSRDRRARAPAVALLAAVPDLASGIDAGDLALARRVTVVPKVELHACDAFGGGPRLAFAAIVLDGLMTREVELGERTASQLLGPGDVFDPWRKSDSAIAARVRWRANRNATIALLDQRFLLAARRWPSLLSTIAVRLSEHAEAMAIYATIAHLPRVEDRLLALMWFLAERWGRVGADGVAVHLPLTHQALGRLVGAQRPTVSLALRDLRTRGVIGRRSDGSWLLAPGSELALSGGQEFGALQTA